MIESFGDRETLKLYEGERSTRLPQDILLEEFIKPMGLTQARMARETGIPASRITEIVKGRRTITAETALRLSRYFGTAAEFWIGLQGEHDLEVAERAVGRKIASEIHCTAAAKA